MRGLPLRVSWASRWTGTDVAEIGRLRRLGLAVVASVLTFGAVASTWWAGLLQEAELRLYDWTRAATARGAPAPEVVLVPVDDADMARWGWPLPDAVLAENIEAVSAAGALAVGVDITGIVRSATDRRPSRAPS